uniref:H/ACA ribonucleoprotein complex non-core subunit NAF1 n=1 Tax=Hyaloperonospora arabidopsidis (strain Emoy2) TaxID=559515 RepID=M4C457_HYAAE
MDAQQPTTTLRLEPVSDLAVAAQYADAELHSVTAQFKSSASVGETLTQSATEPTVIKDDSDDNDDSSNDDDDDKAQAEQQENENAKERAVDAADESLSDEEDEDPAALRAEIEAALAEEENKIGDPLKTENEVAAVLVRTPGVELTADCPIAECGTILNVSVPGLIMTIKSTSNTKLLDEGSVLCLEDRTVLGCVDEVFGPVLMPMYLVRFETAASMPETATKDATVFYATEHTTYIDPEMIKDIGTDASDIFDEEADDTECSDEEAEAILKRGNRKRNRGNAQVTGNEVTGPTGGRGGRGERGYRSGRGERSGRGGNFVDYQARQDASPHVHRGSYGQQAPVVVKPGMASFPARQTQRYGGVTNYTQPGGFGGARPPAVYGQTNYTAPQGNGVPLSPMSVYHGQGWPHEQQALPRGYYQPPPPLQYSAHSLPPYSPHAQSTHGLYQRYPQPPVTAYAQPHQAPGLPYGRPHPPQYNQPPPPPLPAYYDANGQQLPPPPPPMRQPYDQRRY